MTLATASPELHGESLILDTVPRDKDIVSTDSVQMYFNQLTAPIPTHEEEVLLSKRIEAGVYAGALLEMLDGDPAVAIGPLLERVSDPEDPRTAGDLQLFGDVLSEYKDGTRDKEELKIVRADGECAKQELIEACLRLVASIAERYHHHNMAYLDFIQEGNIGLMHAVEKYDYQTGNRVSTYATWWVRQAISRAIEEKAETIRKPVDVQQAINRLFRAQCEFEEEFGRKPDVQELSVSTGLKPDKVRELLFYGQDLLSLNIEVGSEKGGADAETLHDFTPDPRPGPEALVIGDDIPENPRVAELREWLSQLPEQQQNVLRIRFGFEDGQAKSLEETGAVIGRSRERVRQVEKTALAILKKLAVQPAIN